MGKNLWSGGIHHQRWKNNLQKEVFFLRNIAWVSISTNPISYRWGHAYEIEARLDWERFFQSKGEDFGHDLAYDGGNQALSGDTSCFINEDWSLPQRMDQDQEKGDHIFNM